MDTQAPIDEVLTAISVGYFQADPGFIADKVFPIVPVKKQAAKYYVFPANEMNRDTAERRAPASESAGDERTVSSDNYSCETYALHEDVPIEKVKNFAGTPYDPKAGAAQNIAHKMRLRHEAQFLADYMKAGVWSTDITGVASAPSTNEVLKLTAAGSDPIGYVEDWKEAVGALTGVEPNTMAIGRRVWTALKNHVSIVERLKYTQSDAISLQIVADILEIEKLVVSKAIINSAARGATPAVDYMFSDGLFLGYAAASPNIDTLSAGYIFSWDEVSDGMGESLGTRVIPMPALKADRVESEISFDDKVVAPDCGLFVASLV